MSTDFIVCLVTNLTPISELQDLEVLMIDCMFKYDYLNLNTYLIVTNLLIFQLI